MMAADGPPGQGGALAAGPGQEGMPLDLGAEATEPPLGRTRESLSNTRSFRRRIGERRISAPIRIVRSFVTALFNAIIGPGFDGWGGTGLAGITVGELVAYVGKMRYRLSENISDEVAAQMFDEADLAGDGSLDMDELTNTAASCGIESRHLSRWCAVFNLAVDPHIRPLAMPLRVTKRHPIQSNSEATDDAVMFKPDLRATASHGKPAVTSRFAGGPVRGQRRCDGQRDTKRQPLAAQLNATMSNGGDAQEDASLSMNFDALDQFSVSIRAAKAVSEETEGGISRLQMQAGYAPRPNQWLTAAIGELSWPAVPGADPGTSMTLKEQTHGGGGGGAVFNTKFVLDSNQDLRTAYAREFLQEQESYSSPSMHQFRDPADPMAHGHSTNFQRFIENREPCVRPFESQRTGPYVAPSSHSFRPDPGQVEPMRLVFAPKHKEKDIGTGENFKRLALDQIDPYYAHKAYSSKLTLSSMPKHMVAAERAQGPLL